MLDNLNGSNEANEEVSIGQAMYGNESEPDAPTDEEEVLESDDSSEYEDNASVDDQDAEPEESDEDLEELVFDEPNAFVKYEFDEESGLYEFKADGKKVKANIEKLISNYGQVENYTKDKMKLAEERKGVFEEAKTKELNTLKSEAQKYQELSTKLETLMQEKESEINWEELREYDTAEYIKQKELQKDRVEALAKAKAETAEKLEQRRSAAIADEASKMIEAMPEWKDESIKKRDLEMIGDAFDKLGFSHSERENIIDHRAYKAILMAAKYMKASEKAKTTKEVKRAPKSVKAQKTGVSDEPQSYAQLLYGK